MINEEVSIKRRKKRFIAEVRAAAMKGEGEELN